MQINIQTILATLRDVNKGFECDDAWDKLYSIDASYRSGLPLLREALSDPSPSIRIFCLKALARIGGDLDALLPDIILLLKDKDQEVRAEATKFLKKFGQRCALMVVPALRQLANDSNAYLTVRLRAFIVLKKIERHIPKNHAKPSAKSRHHE
jgi:HEAT repeat protein